MSEQSREGHFQEEDTVEPDWERKNIISEKLKNEMESMWEIPQIFHFLQLTRRSLNIPINLSMYEMERMLLMPRASKQLSNIMTCLLSPPNLKSKLHKIPPMPYEFWTNILMHKVRSWFKLHQNKHKQNIKVFESIGVEPEFWDVFPDIPDAKGEDFEKLTFKQRVWLLKTVCDTILHNRKTVQDEISKQPWQNKNETVLGIDRHGARYIYFPQFLQNDLRVYRHHLDNEILSTAKPPTIKVELNCNVKDGDKVKSTISKTGRNRRKKSRWRNGSLPPKGKRRKKNREKIKKNEESNNSSHSTDILAELSTNKNINASNVSNVNDFDHINANSIIARCSGCMSRTCGEYGNETRCSFQRSSESGIFEGFETDCKSQLNDETIIGDILEDLISDVEKSLKGLGRGTLEVISSDNSVVVDKISYHNVEITNNLPSENCVVTSNSGNEYWNDSMLSDVVLEADVLKNSNACSSKANISLISKTGNGMMSEIITNYTSEINAEKETMAKFITSEFSDEELREWKSVEQETDIVNKNFPNDEVGINKWLNDSSTKEVSEVRKEVDEGHDRRHKESETNSSQLKLKREMRNEEISITKEQMEIKLGTFGKDNEAESNTESDHQTSLIKLRDTLINEAMLDDFCYSGDNTSGRCTFQNMKLLGSESWDIPVEDFGKFLTDLSISKFKLVADSVESLRNFIDEFSCNKIDLNESTEGVNASIPVCEVNLTEKLLNLLKSVESIRTLLEDCTQKAKLKLRKEWLNFKSGVMGNTNLDCENRLTYNWWAIGSQNCISNSNEAAALQTTPHSVSSSDKSLTEQSGKGEYKQTELQEQDHMPKVNDSEVNKEMEHEENEDTGDESEGIEQQSKRVLRVRGISSYTEQLLSDNSESEELERWAEFEVSCSTPSVQTDLSANCAFSQLEESDKRSDPEDSDQDWILPSSRKKRNKRLSANRRLKSFQHKLQNVKGNSSLSPPLINNPSKVTDKKNYSCRLKELKSKEESRLNIPETEVTPTAKSADNSGTVTSENSQKVLSSGNMICKVECADSVHSELDIKDEGPIVDNVTNNYNINVQQNYVVVKTEPPPVTNYYVMQQNPPITGVVQGPFIQQNAFIQSAISQTHVHSTPSGYYVQSNPPNYLVQSSHPGFGTPRRTIDLQSPQQMVMQQAPRIIGTQQVITQSNYVQYVVNNPQRSVVRSSLPHPRVIGQNNQRPNFMSSHMQPRIQTRMTMPRQNNCVHPNGAVMRSMPIAGIRTRFPEIKNLAPREVVPPRQQNLKSATTPKLQRFPKPNTSIPTLSSQNTTSLIVLSDSDDEIEMIVTQKKNVETNSAPSTSSPRKNIGQTIQKQKPVVTSEVTVSKPKSILPQQIVQRMSQGGISITPVKTTPPLPPLPPPPPPPPSSSSSSPSSSSSSSSSKVATQLVVVVNETGSHYALALPNGSKLILTPEQVAQIRASNGGKLIL